MPSTAEGLWVNLSAGGAVGRSRRGRGQRLSSSLFHFKKSRPDHSAQALDLCAGRGGAPTWGSAVAGVTRSSGGSCVSWWLVDRL